LNHYFSTFSYLATQQRNSVALNPEEVGHGHVTYVCKRIHAVSLWWFLYWKNDQNFLGIFFDYPKEIGIIRKH